MNLPDNDREIVRNLKLNTGSKISKIGSFLPIITHQEKQDLEVRPYDIGKGNGEEDSFYSRARGEADDLILTATSLINHSTVGIFEKLGTTTLPSMLTCPSIIASPGLYEYLGIHYCAATVVTNVASILKDIRNGRGTAYLHRH